METAVKWTPGSIGFVWDNRNLRVRIRKVPLDLQFNSFRFCLSQTSRINILRNGVALEPTVAAQQACMNDTFDATTLRFHQLASQDPTCWPLTCIVRIVFRRAL